MAERERILTSYQWPGKRSWIVGGLFSFAMIASLRLLFGPSDVFYLFVALTTLALIWRPEKRVRIIEHGDGFSVHSDCSLGFIRRHQPLYTHSRLYRADVQAAENYELSWRDWWSAVRHGGRIEALGAYAVLAGFRRRGLAIPTMSFVETPSGMAGLSHTNIVETTAISIGKGLIEHHRTQATEEVSTTIWTEPREAALRSPRGFIFVPANEPAEAIRTR